MKKKAFTLQELLITMGIIGVIAALTLPALVKMKPDESKVKYMKAYNALANIAPEIANDETLFRTLRDAEGNIQTAGLLNMEDPSVTKDFVDPMYYTNGFYTKALGTTGDNKPVGPTKFGYFLSKRLNLNSEYTTTNGNTVSNFTTTDGISWQVGGTSIPNIVSGTSVTTGYYTGITDCTNVGTSQWNPESCPSYRYAAVIDTNGDKAPNCVFGDANCTSPDRFVFYIYNYGTVEAADKLGKAFLKNPTKMNEVEQDKAVASTL